MLEFSLDKFILDGPLGHLKGDVSHSMWADQCSLHAHVEALTLVGSI